MTDQCCRIQYAFLDVVLLLVCTVCFSDGTRGIFISQTIVSKGQITNVSSNVVINSRVGGTDAKTPYEPSKETNASPLNPLPFFGVHTDASPASSRRLARPGLSVVSRSSRRPRTISWIPVKMYSRGKTSGWVFLPVQSIPSLTSTPPSRRQTSHDSSARRATLQSSTKSTSTSSGNATKARLWSRLLQRLRKTTATITSTCRKSTMEATPNLAVPEHGDYVPELPQEDQQIDYSWERQKNYHYYDSPLQMDPRRYRRYKRDVEESSTRTAEEVAELKNGSTGHNVTGRGRERRQAIDRDTRAVFLFFTVLMLLSLAAMVLYTPSEPPGGSRHFIKLKPRRGDYAKLPTSDPSEEMHFPCPHCMSFQKSNITTLKQPLTFKSVVTAKLLARRLIRRRCVGARPGEQKLQGQKVRGSRRKRPRPKPPCPSSSSLSPDAQNGGRRRILNQAMFPPTYCRDTSPGFQAVASMSNLASSPSAAVKTTGRLRVVLDKWEGDLKKTSNAAKFVVNDVPERTKRVVLQVQLKRKLPCGDTRVYCREVTFNFDE